MSCELEQGMMADMKKEEAMIKYGIRESNDDWESCVVSQEKD